MKCLCCGKELDEEDVACGWHKSCIRKFFGTKEIPEISITDEALGNLALESTNKGYTVTGVQKKMSLHLSTEGKARFTLSNYPTGYILKPQVEEFEALPEAEQLVMCMADAAKISTVPHGLVKDKENLAYITKRIDRIGGNDKKCVKMLAMEDFCQLDLRLTQDKYRGSYERCAKIIQKYSSRKGLDLTELYLRIVFSFVVGNSDMHLKNFSLIETEEKSGEYVLSPAYDLLPVNVIMPEDTEQLALTLNGKKTNICRKDFLVFADGCGIIRKSAERMMDKIISMREQFLSMCNESLLPEKLKGSFVNLIYERSAGIEE